MRSVLLCAALALNAFCAGGMFTFPLMAPALAVHNKLAPAQLTTIILAGMMSQYPVTVFVGALIDRHGPALCTLIGGLLFVAGFGGFASEVAVAPGGPPPTRAAFYRLVAAFLFIGLGTVFSYCSALFAASKYFPRNIGLASGSVMALFALSPLFFASAATRAFVPPGGEGLLDVSAFATFLALVTGGVALFAALTYKRFPVLALVADDDDLQTAPVETTLLLATPDAEQGAVPPVASKAPHAHPETLRALAQTTDFWLLASFCVLVLGAAEMVISNIGTIVASLPPATATARSPSAAAALQVTLLAGANTASRLVVGPLADFVAPPMALGARAPPRAHVVSRFAFLAGAAGLLALTFAWVALGVRNHAQLWALSIGTGLSYSAVFTVIPSLVSGLWGLEHIGRNFGLLMYAPFTGTPVFSYVYASVAAAHLTAGETVCHGRGCWQLTFSLGAVTSMLALCLSVVLWRRWHGTI